MPHKTLVNIKNLTVSYVGHKAIDTLSLSVGAGELVAVVGANGCGKSTLLNVLSAVFRRDTEFFERHDITLEGHIDFAGESNLVYLPQNIKADGWQRDNAEETPEDAGIRDRLERSFGLDPQSGSALSDGQLQKAAIIDALLSNAEIFLLDEPTNYLDIDGITAFEDRMALLKRRGRGIILVTHDRILTDNLADRTILIHPNGIFHVNGGFSHAWSIKEADFHSRRKQAGQIQRKIKQLQEDVRRKAGWAEQKEKQKKKISDGERGEKGHISRLSKKLAKRSQAAFRKAEREIKKLKETKPVIPKRVRLRFPTYEVRNRSVFALRNVSFSYDGSRTLLTDATLAAGSLDKICLMGPNGSGKSTVLRLILGQLVPAAGIRHLNENVCLRYMPQGLTGFFRCERLLDNFVDIGADEATVRRYLGAALICGHKPADSVANFSQGELMRAAVVRCILEKADFLLLDEPTSHLDIDSIEVLENLLTEFQGGFLLISHDRAFVENVSDKLYVLADGHVRLA